MLRFFRNVLILSVLCTASAIAEGFKPVSVLENVKYDRYSVKCVEFNGKGSLYIKKNTSKAIFANGYIRFNKKARKTGYLKFPKGTYCRGSKGYFHDTFGKNNLLTITYINLDD